MALWTRVEVDGFGIHCEGRKNETDSEIGFWDKKKIVKVGIMSMFLP